MRENTEISCWCEANQWKECFRTPKFGLVRCGDCGCYRIDPPPIYSEEQSQSFYTDYYEQPKANLVNTPKSNKKKSRFWQVVAHEQSLGKPLVRVLDIGCGEGDLCFELKQAGWQEVIGIDVSSSRIARARQRFPELSFFDKPLPETGIEPNSVDLIILDNVIEHVPNPMAFLAELRPYLKADARLVVITPNMESGNFKLLGRYWTPELAPHTHIFLFTHKTMYRCLKDAQFSPLNQGTFHTANDSILALGKRFLQGDIRGALWKAGQDFGNSYSRIIQSGAMLYAVAKADQ